MEDTEQQTIETNQNEANNLEQPVQLVSENEPTEVEPQIPMESQQTQQASDQSGEQPAAVADLQPTHEEKKFDDESVEQLVHESVQQLLEKALEDPLIQNFSQEKSPPQHQFQTENPEKIEHIQNNVDNIQTDQNEEQKPRRSFVNEPSQPTIISDNMEQETSKIVTTTKTNLNSAEYAVAPSNTELESLAEAKNDSQNVTTPAAAVNNTIATGNEEARDQLNGFENESKSNQMEQQQHSEEIALPNSVSSSPSIQPPPPPPASVHDQIRMDESRDESQAETIESSAEDDDNENSAVNAVLAAIEQSSTEKAADPLNNSAVSVKTVKKKQTKNMTPNKTSNNFEHLSSSPSSAQKRRKKDPSAPKAPLNGYLVYFNEERADMRQKNPTMSFGELTKIIAIKWKDLPAEEKQKYINEAELDKERYVKEMADYKKSDSYKQYLKESSNAKMARNEEAHHFSSNQKQEKLDNNNGFMNQAASNAQGHNINSLQHEVNVAGFDIPIFTEEFIEHSRNREHEMRQLRKEINELEQQNNVLHKHIENMKQSTTKVESDIEKYQSTNEKVHKSLDIFRQTILNCFSNLPLPNTQEYPSPANIDEYIMKLYSILSTNTTNQQNDNHAFKMHIKSTLSKINFSSLFDSI